MISIMVPKGMKNGFIIHIFPLIKLAHFPMKIPMIKSNFEKKLIKFYRLISLYLDNNYL